MWLCRCDCGNEIEVRGSCLTSGNTKSCGCLINDKIRRKNLSGKKFNKLIFDKYICRDKHRNVWLCKCDCGNEVEVIGRNVVNGNVSKRIMKKEKRVKWKGEIVSVSDLPHIKK